MAFYCAVPTARALLRRYLTTTNAEEEKIRHLNAIRISCGESRHYGFVITAKTNVMVQRPEEIHSRSAGT